MVGWTKRLGTVDSGLSPRRVAVTGLRRKRPLRIANTRS